MAGNFQYFYLLTQPGFAAMGRWQMAQAILLFAGAPLYLIFAIAAAVAATTDFPPAFPVDRAFYLMCVWAGLLYGPKLLGYVGVAVSSTVSRRYGGRARFLAGCAAEILFTLLLDAVMTVSKTLAMVRLIVTGQPGWLPQNRGDRSVGWREAVRLFWVHTIIGIGLLAGFAMAGWLALLWSLPFVGGLVVAVPFCVWSADPRFGQWLQQRGIAAVPEEIRT
jgi:membrane glycosyltransferase